ncbi:MAG: DUF2007 domain-containing protein [Bacteroidales bacterium]|nr:DUF2007 domain-containing protein [Bacteroidales bacterium]
MKVVGKYPNAFSANVAKGMLESEGIPAQVLNEYLPLVAGVVNSDLLSIELAVRDEDYSEAKRLLAACSNAE